MKTRKINLSKRRVWQALLFVLILLGLSALGLEKYAPETFRQLEAITDQVQPGFHEVIYVNDGDTITVRANNQEDKVRFIGIDTPEKDHPSRPIQCYSYAATDYLTELIGDNDVKLVADPTNSNRDRYDRLLRYVYLPDGTLLNAKLIEEGYAFAYTSFPVTKMNEFLELETQAREAGRGLWGACEVEEDNGYINTNPI